MITLIRPFWLQTLAKQLRTATGFFRMYGKSWRKLIVYFLISLGLGFGLSACSSKPPTPDWQINASTAVQDAQRAFLQGNTKVYAAHAKLLRLAVSASGQGTALAQSELALCAAHAASVSLMSDAAPCPAFKTLARNATAAQRAYLHFLTGQTIAHADIVLLPSAQQIFVASAKGAPSNDALRRVSDPLSRLVAAHHMLVTQRADMTTLSIAVQTASEQGWRKALVAWLQVAIQEARQRLDSNLVEQYERQLRIALSMGEPSSLSSEPALPSQPTPPVLKE